MPAKSKSQQKYFGMMIAGKIPMAKGMTKKEVEKMAHTKTTGLPKHVKKKKLTNFK